MDVPLVEQGGFDLLAPDVPLGTPLLESQPRTSEALRFHEDGGYERRERRGLGRAHAGVR